MNIKQELEYEYIVNLKAIDFLVIILIISILASCSANTDTDTMEEERNEG